MLYYKSNGKKKIANLVIQEAYIPQSDAAGGSDPYIPR